MSEMIVYFVDAGVREYVDALEPAPEGYVERYETARFCDLVAASSRGAAKAIALRTWRHDEFMAIDLEWTERVSVRKVAEGDYAVGVLSCDEPLWATVYERFEQASYTYE